MIRNLYIDFTWHSKLPKMLGGEVISNDPKTELLSFVYAFDDCEPVTIDLTQPFVVDTELIEALNSEKVIKYSFNADFCSKFASKLFGIVCEITAWRDITFCGFCINISMRDTNLEWLMSTKYHNVFGIQRYYNGGHLNNYSTANNRPKENIEIWKEFLRQQGELIRAMRDFVKRFIAPFNFDYIWKDYVNRDKVHKNGHLVNFYVPCNQMDVLSESRLSLWNKYNSYACMHMLTVNEENLLELIRKDNDGHSYYLLKTSNNDTSLIKYIRNRVMFDISHTETKINFSHSEYDILYETCMYTYFTGIETNIGNIKIVNVDSDLCFELPSGAKSFLRINGHIIDKRKRVQIYTEDCGSGEVKRYMLGPKNVYKHLYRFIRYNINACVLDELLKADIQVCIESGDYIVFRTETGDNTIAVVKEILRILLPFWIYEFGIGINIIENK